jgi:hypothetical protein
VIQVWRDRRVQAEILERVVRRVSGETQDLKVSKAMWAYKDLQEHRGYQEIMRLRVLKVCREIQDHQDPREMLDRRGYRETQALEESKVCQVATEHRV